MYGGQIYHMPRWISHSTRIKLYGFGGTSVLTNHANLLTASALTCLQLNNRLH